MRILSVLLVVPYLACSGCGKVASRTIGVMSRSAERRAAAVLARDLERDAASKAVQLRTPRRVFRYTTEAQAQRILEKGFAPGMHFTSNAMQGRPLTAAHAAERYGLSSAPEKRFTVTLPAGTSVKSNKVIGGAAGFGELKTDHALKADAVERIVDIPRGR
jgi:uncharacterized protein YceK